MINLYHLARNSQDIRLNLSQSANFQLSNIWTHLSIILSILLFTSVSGSVNAEETQSHIERLKEEIGVLEARMGETESGRKNVLKQLESLQRKVELRRRLVKEYERQVSTGKRKLESIQDKIKNIEEEIGILGVSLTKEEKRLNELRREVGSRISYIYRRLKGDKLALLLGSADLNDLSQRQHYLQAVERYDRSRLQLLKDQRDKVLSEKNKHQTAKDDLSLEENKRYQEIASLKKLISSKMKEEEKFASERNQKQKILDRIAGDKQLLQALLDERRDALQEIENEIARLEGSRPNKRQIWQPDVSFSNLRGKLPWPLEKYKIVQRFGNNKHPTLGTTTINPGIDLAASPGVPVYPVARGEVTRIAWLRGFGTTLILSHGDGFYSVYARLGNVTVTEGEIVSPDNNIAEVGDNGIEGNFHFEVWGNREKQDPLKWLR